MLFKPAVCFDTSLLTGFSERQILRQDFLSTKSSTELHKRLNAFFDFSKTLSQEDNSLSGLDGAIQTLAADRFLRHKSEVSILALMSIRLNICNTQAASSLCVRMFGF
jgi:hypothetical protein